MLKKFMLYLTVVTMLLTMLIPSTGAFAKIGTYDSLASGIIVIEGEYTAAPDGDSRLYFGPSWQTLFKISGVNVYKKADKPADGNIVTLSENEKYFFTLVYERYNSETPSGSGKHGKADIYINGVKVSSGWTDYTLSNHTALSSFGDFGGKKGMQNLVISFATSDGSYVYDMAPYSAVLTSNSENIILGGKDKASTTVFGGFTATVLEKMTAENFLQNVSVPSDAKVSFKRGETILTSTEQLKSGDIVSVTSKNGKVTNEYAISVNAPVVKSSTYTVSNELEISDVYEFTPAKTFLNYLTADYGWTMKLKNGEDDVAQDAIVTEAMTLVAKNTEGETQTYTIAIDDRIKDSTNINIPIKNASNTRGNFIIEISGKTAKGFYTGPHDKSALYVSSDADAVKLGLFKNVWDGTEHTDLKAGDDLNLVFVIRYTANSTRVDYYINGDYVGDADAEAIYSTSKWTTWRIPTGTSSNLFWAEDLDSYLASKNMNKVTVTDGKVSVNWKGASADKLYLAVYNGKELESLQIANLADYNFKQDVLTIPSDITGKTVKAFLWDAGIKPIDCKVIQQAN